MADRVILSLSLSLSLSFSLSHFHIRGRSDYRFQYAFTMDDRLFLGWRKDFIMNFVSIVYHFSYDFNVVFFLIIIFRLLKNIVYEIIMARKDVIM